MAAVKKRLLDLGCGNTPRVEDGYDWFGVDVMDSTIELKKGVVQVKKADLTVNQIPFESNMFDKVTAYDFLEHIPAVIYIGDSNRVMRYTPMITLFNEIYRVLKNDGTFYHETPCYYPDWNVESIWADPTHVFTWTPQTARHFSGDYCGHHADYGHLSKFELIDSYFDGNGHMRETFKAIKPMEPPYEV